MHFGRKTNDIEWSAHGFSGRSLSQLLGYLGRFDEAHRAGPDSWALAWLLMQPAEDDQTYAKHLLDRSTQPHVRVLARRANPENSPRVDGCSVNL